MSVLIKGYKMPETCIDCAMQYGGLCFVHPSDEDGMIAETVEEAAKQGKPDWCPLVEVDGDDVAPVVHGHWIRHEYDKDIRQICSNCKYELLSLWGTKYCPNCGAQMDEKRGKRQ